MRTFLARPSIFDRHVLELDAEILGDHLRAGQDRDVLQHGLAAIAEARCLDGGDLQATAQLVDDEGRQRFAFDVLCDDEQRLAGLHHGLEDRQHRLERGQLLLVDEDVGVFQFGDHLVGVGDEVGRQVAAIELHAFDDIEFGFGGLRLLDGDHALIADLLHRLRDHRAHGSVAIGRNRADLRDFRVGGHLLGVLLEVRDDGLDRKVDTALQIHRVHAGRNRLRTFTNDRLCKHGRCRRTVAGMVVLAGRHFAHHLCAHVLELVGEFDLLGDGDAVLGDARRAERLVDDDVAALGSERHLDGVGEDVDAAQHLVTGFGGEFDVFGCHDGKLLK